jgi:hypothetical protein
MKVAVHKIIVAPDSKFGFRRWNPTFSMEKRREVLSKASAVKLVADIIIFI